MKKTPKILAFAGSTRTGSYNKKLIKIGVEGAKKAGAEVTLIDLKDFPMPLYDGDLEAAQGIPPYAKKFIELMLSHQGFLISAPEYNSSITGVLKNAIDWASRYEEKEHPLICFDGKIVTLMSASPGALGGLRGLVTLRSILGNIKVLVLPDQVAISKAHEAFDEKGNLKDAKLQKSIEGLGEKLATAITKFHG